KTNVVSLPTLTQKFDQINAVTYNKIDDRSGKTNYGFIAQEIEQLFPHLVSKISDYVPSVFCNVVKIAEHQFYCKTKMVTGPIKLYLYPKNADGSLDEKETLCDIIEIDGDKYTVDCDLTDTVFVYGPKVDDYKTLDYNGMNAILVKALQESNSRISTLEERLSKLESLF
ncbi:MAG TPA: tail fiber domain-containing protein, partial [Methylococcales bacterium]